MGCCGSSDTPEAAKKKQDVNAANPAMPSFAAAAAHHGGTCQPIYFIPPPATMISPPQQSTTTGTSQSTATTTGAAHSFAADTTKDSEQQQPSEDRLRAMRTSRNVMPSEISHVGSGRTFLDFKTTLREAGDRLVLIKFYEKNCEDCYAMVEVYKEFVEKYPKVIFLEADIGHNAEACQELRIRFLPTFVAFKHHLEVGRVVNTNIEDLEDLIQKNTVDPKKPTLKTIHDR